jgi:hypothetical protein
MISFDSSPCVTFYNIASNLALHTSPPELRLQIMIHLCSTRVDGIFGRVSFIEYLLAQLVVLWNHQTILEPESAFLIHMKVVDLRVTFGQPPLDMHDSLIIALSYNDFPSQHWGESHIVQSHVGGTRMLDSSPVMLIAGM